MIYMYIDVVLIKSLILYLDNTQVFVKVTVFLIEAVTIPNW